MDKRPIHEPTTGRVSLFDYWGKKYFPFFRAMGTTGRVSHFDHWGKKYFSFFRAMGTFELCLLSSYPFGTFLIKSEFNADLSITISYLKIV